MELYIILVTHWIADFPLQDKEWAVNKSRSIKALLKHTLVYSAFFGWVALWFLFPENPQKAAFFTIITFLAHTITDFFTSKIVAKKFQKKEFDSPIPNFGAFTIIGIDQLLHYIQLFIVYNLV